VQLVETFGIGGDDFNAWVVHAFIYIRRGHWTRRTNDDSGSLLDALYNIRANLLHQRIFGYLVYPYLAVPGTPPSKQQIRRLYVRETQKTDSDGITAQ
jgi:hypothetical protein